MDEDSKIPVVFHEKVIKSRWTSGVYTCTVGPNPNYKEEPKRLHEDPERPKQAIDKVKAEAFSLVDKEKSTDDYDRGFDEGYLSGLNYAIRCMEGKE